MPEILDQQKFNDDLLIGERDRKLAERRYRPIFHVLNNHDLRAYFDVFDKPASRDKRWSRIAGVWAIVLGCIALVIASTEGLVRDLAPLLGIDGNKLRVVIALLAALAGVGGAFWGSGGILFAGRKQTWLCQRLMTERIRQFHFQTFILRLPEVLDSLKDDEAKAAFESERGVWFDNFKARLEGKLISALTEIMGDETGAELWLHENRSTQGEFQKNEALDQLFGAYRELRIMHQINYADYKLSNDHKLLSNVPLRQANVLWFVAFSFIILICMIHVAIVFGVLAQASLSMFGILSSWNPFSPWMSVLVIWIAIGLLGIHAIEQGLQPERETERYQQYRSTLRAIRERFDSARTPAEKIVAMRDLERAAYDEFRNFLVTNERAHFVM